MAQQKQQKENKRVVFRRIGGRIVPISVGGAGVYGAGKALDAARTTELATAATKKAGVRVFKRRFAIQPMVFDTLGTSLTMKKAGKKVATASFYRQDGKQFGFSWIGVGKKYRGEGHSKVISKLAAGEIRRQGGTNLFNHVIHAGSLKTNLTRRDTLWKMKDIPSKKPSGGIWNNVMKRLRGQTAADAGMLAERVGVKAAEKNINWHRARWFKPKNSLQALEFKAMPWRKVNTHSNIFRQTSLKGVPFKNIKEFRGLGNKVTIAAGAAAAVGAAAYFALRGSNGKRK